MKHKKARAMGLEPMARIVGYGRSSVETERAKGLDFNKIDLIEIHEAFASQVLSIFKESERKYGFKWNPDKVNVYGGSLAHTRPLRATNFRLLANVLSRFDEDPSARYALACGCAGGGQGTSFLFENYS